jgi:hypothetical protein
MFMFELAKALLPCELTIVSPIPPPRRMLVDDLPHRESQHQGRCFVLPLCQSASAVVFERASTLVLVVAALVDSSVRDKFAHCLQRRDTNNISDFSSRRKIR